MSANLCTIPTLCALATFAAEKNIQLCLNNGDTLQCAANPQSTVDLLLSANLAALRTRYPQDADYKQPHAAQYRAAMREQVAPVVILKLVNYYNYQACEADGYQGSDAAALMRHIITNAIRALPGYESSPWGLDGDEPRPVLPEPPAVVEVPQTIEDKAARLTADLFRQLTANNPKPTPTPTPTPAPARKPSKPSKPDNARQPRGPF